MKEIADEIGLTSNYLLSKLKRGIDLSIPEADEMKPELVEIINVKAAVSCINEVNKMLGNHEATKQNLEVNVSTKADDLVKEYEKEF
jgi:hypothetical protein